MAEPLIEEVRSLANRLIVDHPHADPAPYMGPVIDNEAADGLTESFLILMSNGGKVIRHMAWPIAGRPFLTPGLIHRSEERRVGKESVTACQFGGSPVT